MGDAKRRRHAMAVYRDGNPGVEEQARGFVVERLLKMTSPKLRRLKRHLMTTDPTGKLLCAYYQHMRETVEHMIAPKGCRRIRRGDDLRYCRLRPEMATGRPDIRFRKRLFDNSIKEGLYWPSPEGQATLGSTTSVSTTLLTWVCSTPDL